MDRQGYGRLFWRTLAFRWARDQRSINQSASRTFWLFQVPGDVVRDHNDIFNYKAASFTLALIQMSGVLASAAGDGWSANFSEVRLD